MSKRVIEIFGGANRIVATTAPESSDAIIVTDLIGWDDGVNIRRNSSSILWENGEAQSTNALFSPRHIEVEIFIQDTLQNIRNLRSKLTNIAASINNLQTVKVSTYDESGLILESEELKVRADGNFFEWQQIENSATVRIFLVAPNPLKTVYLKGSGTPVSGGRI